MNTSPFLAIKRLETQLLAALRAVDIDYLAKDEKQAVSEMRREITDTRLDIRDYELSETREEQLKCAREAKRRISTIEACILRTGNVFGAADTAQISAQFEQIKGWLI